MLKNSYLFATLSLTSVIGGNAIINQTKAHSWQPTWFEKEIAVNHEESKLAIKDGHDKWHMQLSKDDLDIPNNARAIEIKNLRFSYKLWFKVLGMSTWEDNSWIELNNDELAIATSIIANHDMTHNKLNLWVEGWNLFTNLQVKTSIEEIPSAYSDLHYGDAVSSYNIYNFSSDITYKYLLESEDNFQLENAVYDLLATEHDWGLTTFHNKQNVLNLTLKKLLGKIPVRLHKYVKLSLIDEKNNEDFLQAPTQSLRVRAIVFGRTLAYNLKSKEQLQIKIKNIQGSETYDVVRNMIETLQSQKWQINLDSIDSTYRQLDHRELSIASFQFFYKWANKYFELDIKHMHGFLLAYTFRDSDDGIFTKLLDGNHEVIGVIRFI